MIDLAKIGLPLQVGGFLLALIGFTHIHALQIGLLIHLAGDVLFFLQMRKQKCI